MENRLSPMMQHYLQTKEKFKDCILFYRLGDFYEMFYEDAIEASQVLDLVLTEKACGLEKKAPMCGIPYHAADQYILKLIQNGYKVAICEQLSDQPTGKVKVIDRDVVQIVTPGTVTSTDMLEDKRNNYLLSLYKNGDKVGASYCDIMTGEFKVVPLNNLDSDLSDLISRIQPSEVIGNKDAKEIYESLPIYKAGYLKKIYEYYNWAFEIKRADENLKKQLGDNYQKIYELVGKNELIISAGVIIEYLNETQKRSLGNINRLEIVRNERFMTIDPNSRRNLEIMESFNKDRSKRSYLLGFMDQTKTKMGGRKLRKYFNEPLQDSKEINLRLDAVEELVKKLILRDSLGELNSKIGDIERLSGRIAYGNVTPKELLVLKNSLQVLPQIKKELENVSSKYLKSVTSRIQDFSEVATLLQNAIDENAGNNFKEGDFIKDGFNSELDEYRAAKKDGKEWVKKLEEKERELTGIKNLRIIQNRVFGYFIEVNRSQIEHVPIRYIRKQTVANNERYITEDLKELEEKIYGAEEKSIKLEELLYDQIKQYLLGFVKSFQEVADAIATLDALWSLATVASVNNFCKPTINPNIKHIKIEEGRHPVVEAFLNKGNFISNDCFLNEDSDRIMIITGPNMAGKSTFMRQVAIITFLAHIGSFVPAKSAEIAITDRIFTRVGASDDLVFGQSTFMVEMSEVATILANATDRSLIVLDEIGRGTSTFDGLSIAWAVVEHIANNFKAKTLFATHYHELTELEGVIEGVKNYKIAVKEIDGSVVFLRKIVRGGANRSFGIQVAKLAGLPVEVLNRATEISENLEAVNNKLDLNIFKDRKEKAEQNSKLALQVLNALKDIDMNRISPMHAFDLLNDLVLQVKEGENK